MYVLLCKYLIHHYMFAFYHHYSIIIHINICPYCPRGQ